MSDFGEERVPEDKRGEPRQIQDGLRTSGVIEARLRTD